MSTSIPEECIRNEEEIEIRKQRAELYRKLREENDKTRKAQEVEDMDAFFGGGNPSGKSSGGGGGNVSTLLKKVKSVCSRLATLNASNADSQVQSLLECNLSHFIEETVLNLSKANIKMADVPSFVRVCSVLYQQYPKDFPKLFQDKIFEIIKNKETTAPRRRTILCAYCDLLIVHVYINNAHLLPILVALIKTDISDKKFENDSYIWRIITHCGADLVGVGRGPNTIMDPIFPKESVLPEIRTYLSKYYTAITEEMRAKADEGMKAREDAYQLFLQMGKFNTRPDEKAKECKSEYDKLLSMAKKYGFIMKKEPEEFWKNEEEMVEITTPEGPVLIPKRIADKIRPNDPINTIGKPNDSQPLVDINTILTEKLTLDIDGIRKELERAQNMQRVDLLSIYYLSIDSPENQEKVIEQFSHISRNNINVTQYFARFIANISQKFPEIGNSVAQKLEKAFISFVNAQNKSQGTVAFSPKLYIARYISELAMLNVGIESFFSCLSFSLGHFYGKTIDMACTLILTAGKFLDDFCDATHIRIRKAVSTLKQLREKEVFQQHIGVIINQAIELFEKPEETQKESKPIPSLNKYQAFVQHILLSNDRQKNEREIKELIERMWSQSEVTHVTQFFVISQILELENFSLSQFNHLSKIIFEFSKTNQDFVISLVDILLERIRRGIERDSFVFRQRQLLEVRFLSELVNSRVISYDVALSTATQILSLSMPKPSNYLIVVEGRKSHRIQINQSDFFKVKMVCELIDALLPSLKKYCSKKNTTDRRKQDRFSYTPGKDDSKDFDIKFTQNYSDVLFHLQLFCLIRNPIPTQTAFDISDLFDKLEFNQIENTDRYESLTDEKLRERAKNCKFTSFSLYEISPHQSNLQTVKKIETPASSSDESSESVDDSDPDEELFRKELNEVKEEFRQEAKAQNPNVKRQIPIPVDLLLSSPAKQLDESEKMTPHGPPIDFNIAIPKGDKTVILSFSPLSKDDDQPKPQ